MQAKSLPLLENVSEEIIDNFNKIIPSFYDAKDRLNGYIESIDRDGSKKRFPLMSTAIGIVHNKIRKFSHYGEIAEAVSEMKEYSKHAGDGCYKIDKRSADPHEGSLQSG